MGTRIRIYPEITEPNDDFDMDGPEVFSFENTYTTSLVCGSNSLGVEIHAGLNAKEQDLLAAKGFVFEDSLVAINPKELSQALLAFYARASKLIAYGSQKDELIDGFRRLRLLSLLQKDIGGALLMCTLAAEKKRRVYWALG